MKNVGRFSWEIFLLILTFVSLGFLAIEITSPHYIYRDVFFRIDMAISFIFLADFAIRLAFAKNARLFWRENWIQLFASLPAITGSVQMLQFLRILRFARFVKIIHAHNRLIMQGDMKYDGEAFRLFNIIVIVLTLLFSASLVFFDAEYGINPRLHNFFDAVWWAFNTMTTTGYGDIYPVTTTGRLCAMFLMFFGIGTFAALVATFNEKMFGRKEKYIDRQSVS